MHVVEWSRMLKLCIHVFLTSIEVSIHLSITWILSLKSSKWALYLHIDEPRCCTCMRTASLSCIEMGLLTWRLNWTIFFYGTRHSVFTFIWTININALSRIHVLYHMHLRPCFGTITREKHASFVFRGSALSYAQMTIILVAGERETWLFYFPGTPWWKQCINAPLWGTMLELI